MRRIDARGQVTIPKALRTLAGLTPGTEVTLEVDGAVIRIRRVPGAPAGQSDPVDREGIHDDSATS